MVTAVTLSYSAASGAGIHAGRYPGGRLSGAVALGDAVPGGGLTAAAGALSGAVLLDDAAPAGAMQTQVDFSVGSINGQSNPENMFAANDVWRSGDQRARAYKSGSLRRIGNIADTFPPGSPSSVYGGAYTQGDALVDGDGLVCMANAIAAAAGGNILIYPCAVGGSAISTWLTGGTNWTTYANTVAAGGQLPAWGIWLQGESDAGGDMAVYASRLASVQAQHVALSGRSAAAFGFAVIPLGPCTTAWTAEGNFAALRTRQLAHAASSTGAWLVNSSIDAPLFDSVHYTVAHYVRQGRRWGEWVKRWAAGNGGALAGPRITGATRTGQVITITVAHAGGTTLADGAGGAGAALAGFRVFDGGTPATISATAITSNTTITLTLSAVPAGAVTLDFAMANLPFGSQTPAANTIVYDNTTIGGDTLGIPMQPCPTITVT